MREGKIWGVVPGDSWSRRTDAGQPVSIFFPQNGAEYHGCNFPPVGWNLRDGVAPVFDIYVALYYLFGST